MTTLEQRVQELEDIEEIKALKIKYAQVCDDNYDPPGIGALFTEDAVWDGGEGFGVHDGRQAIQDFFADVRKDFTFALHYYMGPQINVDPSGRTATGTWYMWLPATVSGRAMIIAATYDEDYKKVSGRWFFSRMKINMKFITPYESGWVKEPMALG